MSTLSRAVRSGLKPTPSSMNGDRRPATEIRPLSTRVDSGDALQQRALAAAVAPDYPEELALGDLQGEVLKGVQFVVFGAPQRVQCALLERRVLLVGDPKGLADAFQRDGCWSRLLGGRAGGLRSVDRGRQASVNASNRASDGDRTRWRRCASGSPSRGGRTLGHASAGTVARAAAARQDGVRHPGSGIPRCPARPHTGAHCTAAGGAPAPPSRVRPRTGDQVVRRESGWRRLARVERVLRPGPTRLGRSAR